MIYDVIVIGGGAAGMMAAGSAGKFGRKTLLLEKNHRLGKKLLITGKGRCNVTNSGNIESFIQCYGKNGRFLYRAFSEFSNENLVSFFEYHGTPLKTERGGRIFPLSDESEDVLNALKKYISENNVQVNLNSTATDIKQENEIFLINTKAGQFYKAQNVIVATGGLSYPSTGSTGDGYAFAKAFGHTIKDLIPALVPLETKENFVKDLQGLSLKNVSAKIFSNGKEIASEFGEMLFTHFGVSGPIILTLSGYICEELKKGNKTTLSINFKPALDKETLNKRLLRELDSSGKKVISNVLKTLLPEKIVPVFVDLSSIPEAKLANQVTKTEREKLQELLTDFRLEISKARGFEEAIITKGGIALNEINPYTMESKKAKGLFFCGEIIDIDGITGGYNLQEAFSTGYLAAKGACQ